MAGSLSCTPAQGFSVLFILIFYFFVFYYHRLVYKFQNWAGSPFSFFSAVLILSVSIPGPTGAGILHKYGCGESEISRPDVYRALYSGNRMGEGATPRPVDALCLQVRCVTTQHNIT